MRCPAALTIWFSQCVPPEEQVHWWASLLPMVIQEICLQQWPKQEGWLMVRDFRWAHVAGFGCTG